MDAGTDAARAAAAAADSAPPTRTPHLRSAWVLLVEPEAHPRERRPVNMRRLLAQIALAGVVVGAVVAGGGWLVGRHIAEQQAVHDVGELTNTIADSVVQPALTDAAATNAGAARAALDKVVRAHVLSGELVRVKLWTRSGTILYSDKPQLVGQHFDLEDEAHTALTRARIEADISNLKRPENRFERSQGKLLEVYRPVWTPDGTELLFETYFRYDAVDSRSHQLWRGFGGVMVSSLAALMLLLAPVLWALVLRARRSRDEQEKLTRQALDASDEERRRIAATLHDGVVQQLAAASFTAAGAATRAQQTGDDELAHDAGQVAATVRDGLTGLRSLLVDIYPPALSSAGLAASLRDLAHTTSADLATVHTDIDTEAADSLAPDAQQSAFRVAQEALRNAVKHADAHEVRLLLHDESPVSVLEISDDGRGFDAGARDRHPEGHFGLRLMIDAARKANARLAVSSAPGRGTTVRLEMARGAAR